MRGMIPVPRRSRGLHRHGIAAATFMAAALMCVGHTFVASPAPTQQLVTEPQNSGQAWRKAGIRQPVLGVGPRASTLVTPRFSWRQACGAAFALACAAFSGSSKTSRGRVNRPRCAVSVVCGVAPISGICPSPMPCASHGHATSECPSPAPPCIRVAAAQSGSTSPRESTSPRVEADEIQHPESKEPILRQVAAAPPAGLRVPCIAHAAPLIAEDSATCAHITRHAARRVGRSRIRCSSRHSFIGKSSSAAAGRSHRASRQRMGSRLQQADAARPEVVPPSFDISRVRAQIQMGLQVTSGVSAMHGREHKNPKACSPGASKSSSVRYQTMSFLQARECG